MIGVVSNRGPLGYNEEKEEECEMRASLDPKQVKDGGRYTLGEEGGRGGGGGGVGGGKERGAEGGGRRKD